MGSLGKLLSAPLDGLLRSISDVIDKVHTSADEKLAAQRELVQIERTFHVRMAELDVEWARTQADVVKSEVASQSWMARNWRPLTMLTFTYIVAHNFILAPLFGLITLVIPPDLWDLLKLGMGGYVAGRTIEKITPAVTEAVIAGKKK